MTETKAAKTSAVNSDEIASETQELPHSPRVSAARRGFEDISPNGRIRGVDGTKSHTTMKRKD
jgi:hypothetical protein